MLKTTQTRYFLASLNERPLKNLKMSLLNICVGLPEVFSFFAHFLNISKKCLFTKKWPFADKWSIAAKVFLFISIVLIHQVKSPQIRKRKVFSLWEQFIIRFRHPLSFWRLNLPQNDGSNISSWERGKRSDKITVKKPVLMNF